MSERSHTSTSEESVDHDELLPIGEAAKALGVSIATIRRWDDAGQIRSVRTLGGQRRFARSEVERVRRGEAATA